MKVNSLKAKEILDSKGSPTIQVELKTEKGVFVSAVPSGTSTGKYEAKELRDGDKRYDGKGVLKAVENVSNIFNALKNLDFKDQSQLDDFLLKLDGTEDKSNLGANAILSVSMAYCRAFAEEEPLPLYRYIGKLAGKKSFTLPFPCFNLLEGGKHTRDDKDIDIQEFMVITKEDTFKERLKAGFEIYKNLENILTINYGKDKLIIGDEGGFAPHLKTAEQALAYLVKAINIYPKTKIGLDVAATHFYSEKKYYLEGKTFTINKLTDFYNNLIKSFPIVFIEDPFNEEDWKGFALATKELNIDIFGDDLLTTNIKRIKKAKKENACNGLILKVNQIGTVSEALKAVKLARSFGWKILVAHRAGETMDDFIADLSVGISAEYIKSGAPFQKERLVKYERLVKIEELLLTEEE